MLELFLIALGAALAFLSQAAASRGRRAHTGKRLAHAFFEELSALHVSVRRQVDNDIHTIEGFSSQTFDSLFPQVSEGLPDSLTRDLMRYHWRMKLLVERQKTHGGMPGKAGTTPHELKELMDLRTCLMDRLRWYGNRTIMGIMIGPGEKGARRQLGKSADKKHPSGS